MRPQRPADADLREFEPPEGASGQPKQLLEPEEHNWRVIRDLASDVSTLEVADDRGVYRLKDIDLVTGIHGRVRYFSSGDDFASARGETERT